MNVENDNIPKTSMFLCLEKLKEFFNVGDEIAKLNIVISGSIGVGKSTLAKKFQENGYKVFFESIKDNPYLKDFYGNPQDTCFKTQIYFFAKRFQNYNECQEGKESIDIHDRSFVEDWVFAKNCQELGYMNEIDFQTYELLYQEAMKKIEIPQVILYLNASPEQCENRIEFRYSQDEERSFEKKDGIPLSYLQNLSSVYQKFLLDISKKSLVFRINWESFQNESKIFDSILNLFEKGSIKQKTGIYSLL